MDIVSPIFVHLFKNLLTNFFARFSIFVLKILFHRTGKFVCIFVFIFPALPTVKTHAIENPECIAPAKPGGGHDLTCQLLSNSLYLSHLSDEPMKIRYMPGGIGALAYNLIAGGKRKLPNTIVAFSTGSALNLAQKKFGKYDETSVRWLGALVTDYGIIAVRKDSSWNTLGELIAELKADTSKVIFGAGGSIGSQDWMKSALMLKQAGVNPKLIRYVAYEGGGESINALLNNHINVFPGDLAETSRHIDSGDIRVLAVFSKERVKGKYHSLPTAAEQGYPIEWPIWRGYYLPPNVSNDDYRWWENTLRRLVATEAFEKERLRLGFFPFTIIGQEFETFVQSNVLQLRILAREFELLK